MNLVFRWENEKISCKHFEGKNERSSGNTLKD